MVLPGFYVKIIFFQTSGVTLALSPYHELADDVGPGRDMPRSRFTGITLAHNVRERHQVDQVLSLAAAAGGEVVKPAGTAEWGGYGGYFTDPDGYLWKSPGAPSTSTKTALSTSRDTHAGQVSAGTRRPGWQVPAPAR